MHLSDKILSAWNRLCFIKRVTQRRHLISSSSFLSHPPSLHSEIFDRKLQPGCGDLGFLPEARWGWPSLLQLTAVLSWRDAAAAAAPTPVQPSEE